MKGTSHVTILGAGAWGTALAVAMSSRHAVTLHARNAEFAQRLEDERTNARYLPGVAFSDRIRVTADLTSALFDADLVFIATPVSGLEETCRAIAPLRPANVIWMCKGLDAQRRWPHEIVAGVLPGVPAAALSGPSFAAEVARGLPTALTVASEHDALVAIVADALHGGTMRIYRSDDLIGTEVGGAVKNVLAIATGICEGLSLGTNARAALMTRGLAEMMRLALALGARGDTMIGLAGLGDLILTCTGTLSRNRKVGIGLGEGRPLEEILADLGHVAEGVHCARAISALADGFGLEMPITDAVVSVMDGQTSPSDAVRDLLSRVPRPEFDHRV